MSDATRYYVYVLRDPSDDARFFFCGILQKSGVDEHSGLIDEQVPYAKIHDSVMDQLSEAEKKLMDRLISATESEQPIPEWFRVVARELQSKEHAESVRDALVFSTLRQFDEVENGHRKIRFLGDYSGVNAYLTGFDLNTRGGESLRDDGSHPCGKYFVYALRDPQSGRIFYIGKGQGARVSDHFRKARQLVTGDESAKSRKFKLKVIQEILAKEIKPDAMTRILARTPSESTAFLLEAFFMKFYFGLESLENATGGHYHDLIRANGDWHTRRGFEIRESIKGTGGRKILWDLFDGQGLSKRLDSAVNSFTSRLRTQGKPTSIEFGDPRIVGAGELSRDAIIETSFGEVVLRLQIRSAATGAFHCMIVPGGSSNQQGAAAQRLRELFKSINPWQTYTGDMWLRNDGWFNCDSWRVENLTTDIEVMTHRALMLHKLATSPSLLSVSELAELFPRKDAESGTEVSTQ